jgi:pimeloyl-ACP methyl ester carboxylesterase
MFLQRSGILLLLAAQIVTGSEFVRKDIALDEGQLSFLLRPGETPALILIPGSFWDSSLWDEVIPHLDHEMSLVLVEMRGHGRSWPPAKDGSIELFATDVLRVADALGLNEFYVGGHSIGGMVALEVGDRRPESVLGVVSIEGWTNHHAAHVDSRVTDKREGGSRKSDRPLDHRTTQSLCPDLAAMGWLPLSSEHEPSRTRAIRRSRTPDTHAGAAPNSTQKERAGGVDQQRFS